MFTAPNPVDQHAISAAACSVVVGVVDRGDVEHDRHVAAHLHRRGLGEDLPEPPVPDQPVQADQQVLGDVVIAGLIAAVHRDLAQLLGRVPRSRRTQVAEHRHPVVAVVEDPQRARRG